jgi:hypothetical protein
MTNAQRNSSATLLAFLAGAAVWAFFGPKIKNKVLEFSDADDWDDLRNQVERKFAKAKDNTQETYDKIVDEVTDRYARAKGISQNELQDLIADLKTHWNRIKGAWNEGGDIE